MSSLQMSAIPNISGGFDAYEFYVEAMLHFACVECGKFIDASSDIREGEDLAPAGPWASRHAKTAMLLGWYVHPLSSDGSLVPFCLCPSCAAKRGLKILDA